jgi:hypothetical protein
MTAFAGVNWARALSRGQNPLGWKAIAVAHVLADHVDGDGHCVLKQETIAREARISEHAVRDGLKELRALGAVSDKRTRGASRFHLNTDTTRRTSPAHGAAHGVETGTTRLPDRHEVPTRPAPHADGREVLEGDLSKALSSNGAVARESEIVFDPDDLATFKGMTP